MSKGGRRSTAIPRTGAPTLAGTPNGVEDKRLSISECRRLLGTDCKLTDVEIENLCDAMYALADISITEFVAKNGNHPTRNEEAMADQVAAA